MSVSNKFIEEILGDWTVKTSIANGLITLDTGLPGTTLVTGDLSVVGNVSFTGNATTVSNTIALGTSSVSIPTVSGNAVVTIAGANIASFSSDGLSVVGNVTSTYLMGNGAFITGLPASYGNADVAAYLPTYTGNLVALQGNIVTSANVTGNYFIGNGSQLTGMYGNADVSAYLPTYTGNLNPDNLSVASTANVGTITLDAVSGNVSGMNYVSANYYIGNGALLTGVTATNVGTLTNLSVTGNAVIGNVTSLGAISAVGDIAGANLQTSGTVSAAGNVTAGNIATTGQITATGDIASFGNVVGGNVQTSGTVSAAGNVTGGNLLTAGSISTGGNIAVSGNVSIAGRIEGSNVKIGTDAGLSGQSYNGIAVGLNAGATNQGLNAIAIGDGAGATNQSANSIILNASGSDLNAANSGLYISPIRNDNANNSNILFYNTVTKELTYTNNLSLSGNIAVGNLEFTNASATGNVTIDGDLSVTGNAYLAGNIVGDRIQNGNTIIDIQDPGSNVNISVGGVSNVAVFATAGISLPGNVVANNVIANNLYGTLATASQPNITSLGTLNSLDVSANITAGGLQIPFGNAILGNLYVSGNTTIAGNITQISGNSGQFFGNADTGFNALYAGLPAGFSLLPQSVVNFVSIYNGYSQINNQNLDGGDQATTDWVLTSNNGDDNTYYFDIGMTSSGFNGTVAGANNAIGNAAETNDAYMYVTANVAAGQIGNLILATVDTGSQMRFVVGGRDQANIAMRLNAPNTDSNDSSTGSLLLNGGAGIAGNINSGGGISATGNVAGNYILGNGSQLTGLVPTIVTNGTSNINIATPNGNVTVSVDGTGNVAVFSSSGLNLNGNLSVTGNVIGDYFVGNGTALTGVMADRGGDPNNWNTLTQMGVYTVNRVSWSGTTGTPLDSQVYVGLLEVKNSTGVALEQTFYPGTVTTGDAQTQWNRNYWSGSWTPWLYVVNNDQVVTGGDF